MNINWRKVLGVAEKVIHVINESISPTERENRHGKHHSNNHSDYNNSNKKGKVNNDIH